jgi:hypothetical protein
VPAFLDVIAKLRNESLLGRFDGKSLVFPSHNIEINSADIRGYLSLPFLGLRLKSHWL